MRLRHLTHAKERPLKPHGNLTGLKPNQLQRLSRLYQRKVSPHEIISASLALSLGELSRELNRQIGVTIDRRGLIKHVIVGDTDQLFIPDLGRARGGRERFRGVRLIHTHLRGESVSDDDVTDLVRLQLDMMGALTLTPEGRPEELHYTYMLPAGSTTPYAPITATPILELTLDFSAFIEDLEDQFGRATVGAIETEGQVRAIAVHVSVDRGLDPQTSLLELSELARTAGVVIVDALLQNRRSYDAKYVMGRGKLDELLLLTMQLDCELVIFDQDLTPNQVRSISAVTDVKVIDRSLLILDIFARRAHTREGKLAVELAQQRYLLPRLAHNNVAFSRLAGGIGGRGPGETKLEIDRRRARERITTLERALDKAEVHRENQRARRQGRGVPHVAIVGYTNAGKSTLFNSITQSDVLEEDKLFATLHVTTRRLRFPQNQELLFTDTVGFIRDLPKDLEVAFKATLEEAVDADLLLHVVDASDPYLENHIASVKQILGEMDLLDRPRLLVFNKIDLLNPTAAHNLCALHDALGVSALDRASTRPLLSHIQAELGVELLDWAQMSSEASIYEQLRAPLEAREEQEAELEGESGAEPPHHEALQTQDTQDTQKAQEALAAYYQAQYQQAPEQEESALERRARRRKEREEEDFWA